MYGTELMYRKNSDELMNILGFRETMEFLAKASRV